MVAEAQKNLLKEMQVGKVYCFKTERKRRKALQYNGLDNWKSQNCFYPYLSFKL